MLDGSGTDEKGRQRMTNSQHSSFLSDRRARAAVRLLRRLTRAELAQVIALMPELRSFPAPIPPRESAEDYWRRALYEERGDYQPTLDFEFLDGMTYREYFALSEAEQDAFWDKIFLEEAWEADAVSSK
jgi:hypothetical protein